MRFAPLAISFALCACPSPPPQSTGPTTPPNPPPVTSAPRCAASFELPGEAPATPAAPPLSFALPKEIDATYVSTAKPATCEAPAGDIALLGRGSPVAMCCDNGPPPDTAAYVQGCRRRSGCSVRLPPQNQTAVGEKTANTVAEVVAAVAPVDDASEALGLVALSYREVWAPITDAERAQVADLAQRYGWQWTANADQPIAVQPTDDGWILRVPAFRGCGCEHALWRVAFQVTRDGKICPLDEAPVLLAASTKGLCVD